MEFFDVVLNQRACRQFSDRPVDSELVERCLEAAVHAPSAENRQPTVFLVLQDPAQRDAVNALTRRAWREGGRAHSEGRLAPAFLKEVDEGAERGIALAPILIVVCGDASIGLEVAMPASVFPATQNLLLAANALGLGSALTTLATRYADELRSLLDLPAWVHPMAVIPLGWPGRPLGRPRRLPLAERVHVDRFGQRWNS